VLPNGPERTDRLRVLDEQPALDLEQQLAFTVIDLTWLKLSILVWWAWVDLWVRR
jgi:hypothetical protein